MNVLLGGEGKPSANAGGVSLPSKPPSFPQRAFIRKDEASLLPQPPRQGERAGMMPFDKGYGKVPVVPESRSGEVATTDSNKTTTSQGNNAATRQRMQVVSVHDRATGLVRESFFTSISSGHENAVVLSVNARRMACPFPPNHVPSARIFSG